MSKPIAIIPARAGSKRIPKKNIRQFLGRPIINYSIELALGSNLFDRVIVSTDSDEVAKVAEASGATVPFHRPPDLSDDHTPLVDVLSHALNAIEFMPEQACLILPTAPLLQQSFLKNGYELIKQDKDAVSAVSVTSFPSSIFRALKLEDGRLQFLWPENEFVRSNDLPKAFYDAGQFYWVNTRNFLGSKRLLGQSCIGVQIPSRFVQDIDEEDDWIRAENLYRLLHQT